MTSFTDPFGGDTIPPAEYAYAAYTLTENEQLYWPFQYDGTTGLLAASILEIDPSLPGLILTLPPANQVSVGYDVLIRNTGANNLDVVDYSGGAIATIVPGESRYVYVADNTTAGGLWHLFTYGTGTSSADASALAGEGLEAGSGQLHTKSSYRSINSNDTIALTDRAKSVEIVSGSITLTLPQASVATDGFYVLIRNSAAGSSVIEGFGTEQIDGGLNKTLSPGESAIFICNSTYWITVGYGRDATFVFSEFVVNMAGGDITLTSADVAGRMIRLAGTAAGNLTVTLPTVDNIYFINIESGLGGFNATFTTGSGAIVILLASQKTVLYCDGTNVNSAITTSVTSTISLDDGSAAIPSLNFSLDTDTGFFRPGSNRLGISTGGIQVTEFNSLGLTGSIVFTPVGGIAATTVAGALAELDTEKVAKAGDTMTGTLVFSGNGLRVKGDTQNAIVSNRFGVQDSAAVGTAWSIFPGATGTNAALSVEQFENTTTGNGSAGQMVLVPGSAVQINSMARGAGTVLPLTFNLGGVQAAQFDNSRNLTIGTGAPAGFKFEVFDGTTRFVINPSTSLGYIGTATNHPIVFLVNNTEKMRATPSGELLIGVSALPPAIAAGALLMGVGNISCSNFGGSGVSSAIVYGGVDSTNAPFVRFRQDTTDSRIEAGRAGAAAFLPLTLYTNGAEKGRLDLSGNFVLNNTTGGLGYGTGAGGAVTQLTNKATAVTLNRPTGQITMNNAALAAGASVTFQLNNTVIVATDCVMVNPSANANYRVEVAALGGAAVQIRVTNVTGGPLSEALVVNFVVIRGVAA